jgi:serine/threonine-protein kinase RsbW
MTDPLQDSELDLLIPPKPEYVRTVRLTVGTLARLRGLPDEMVEDIKLAVSEACTTALPPEPGGEPQDGLNERPPIRVVAAADERRFVIELSDPSAKLEREVAGSPLEISTGDLPFERVLSLPVIRGLVDEFSVARNAEGGATLRMVLAIAEQAGR